MREDRREVRRERRIELYSKDEERNGSQKAYMYNGGIGRMETLEEWRHWRNGGIGGMEAVEEWRGWRNAST